MDLESGPVRLDSKYYRRIEEKFSRYTYLHIIFAVRLLNLHLLETVRVSPPIQVFRISTSDYK